MKSTNQAIPAKSRFSGVLKAIGTTQPAANLLFEQVIHRLLQALTKPGGGTVTPAKLGVPWDLEIDRGLPGIDGAVIVEVKFLANCVDTTLNGIYSAIRRNPVSHPPSALFVLHGRLTPRAKTTLNELQRLDPSFHVWDYDSLTTLFDDPSVPANIEQIARQNPENIVTALQVRVESEDWKTRKRSSIDAIRRSYHERNLTLFVGAGVSMGAQLPSWDKLLAEISAETVGQSAKIDVALLQPILQRFRELSSSSPIVLARYLEAALRGPNISALVRDALYRDVIAGKAGHSETLIELARLCAPRRSSAGIRAVITYNYDDLLEHHLEAQRVASHTITNGSYQSDAEKLPIYHAHGFLPRPGTDEELGEVVLSEDSYHALYLNPYHWANVVQLNTLTDSTCLFVGHSMSDPNLRRLLEASKKACFRGDSGSPHVRHYAILLRISSEAFGKWRCPVVSCANSSPIVASPADVANFLEHHHNTEESVYQQLGVGVIWVESFDEIPSVLGSISASSK